jgi:hypothetical protein
VSGLLAHARKQEISLPVACLLVSMWSASQLFKLHTRRSLNDGLQRLQERFSISPGEGSRLPLECLLSHLAPTRAPLLSNPQTTPAHLEWLYSSTT